ncbi:hypothetical protein BG005_003750 [Podila minutissima]|nr:hypothetical protein BG005_003750 [Podila minutissima]
MMPPSFIDRIFNGENLLPFVKTVTIASMGIAAGFLLSYNAMIMPALRKFSASSAVSVWAETAHGAMSFFLPINKFLFAIRSSGKDDGTNEPKTIQWNKLQYGRTPMNVTSCSLPSMID